MSGGFGAAGVWCERVVYRSARAEEVASWTVCAVADPVRAVRAIRADARRLAGGVAGGRALRRVAGDGGGRVGAVAALYRGESCGLALDCGGVWVEWSARPVLFLPVVSRTGPRCAGTGEGAGGFGLLPVTGAGFR
ncbi:hypothetical protein LVX13_19335 [Streptomyces albulus]|uniref:hypothetical protein n=1 Tax=Streptomyces noursei TaxID=1971 RepID=UPI001F408092|nr:hypothetical protein [Streptomyces noursei]MCE4945249.1 hypothetical protein [Streptomyces noursei]